MLFGYNISEKEILAFSLVLLRITAFFFSWPIFGQTSVPVQTKILISLLLAFLLYPVVGLDSQLNSMESLMIFALAFKEVALGIVLGFLCRLFFFVVSMCGELVSISMGLSSAHVLNPTIGAQSTAIEQFQVVLASLFFLMINGHHILLAGFVKSFEIMPITPRGIQWISFRNSALILQDLLVSSLKIAAPIMVSVLFMNIAVGIVGRAVPQINVLITSWPVNILLSLFILIIVMPLFVDELSEIFSQVASQFISVMRTF